MYTPPAVSPQETLRSESQASEEEEDEDELSQDADLGYRPMPPMDLSVPSADSTDTPRDQSTDSTPQGTTNSTTEARETTDGEEEPSVVMMVANLDDFKQYREVAHTNAMCWELSSAKPGNGVEQLRDPSTETYWQSDGTTQPHWVQITFRRRLPIVYVALYLDFQLDESYTPKTLSIETGMTSQDLNSAPQNRKIELVDPVGWSVIAVHGSPDPLTAEGETTTVKTHLIRINILSMHQNGRDTHIRRLAVFAERTRPPLIQVADNRGSNANVNDDEEADDTNLTLPTHQPFSMSIR